MDERHRMRAARVAQQMRTLQHRVSRFALAAGAAEEQRTHTRVQTETASVDAAFSQWSAHLQAGVLDQDSVQRFADNAAQKEDALREANAALAEAKLKQQALTQANGEAQLRVTQARGLLRSLRRKTLRKAEEASLRTFEDRVSFHQQRDP